MYTQGRSAGDHTLSINMRRMKQLDVNLTDSRSDTNMTMTLGTGRIWEDAYKEVIFNARLKRQSINQCVK